MLFFPATKKELKEIHTCLTHLEKQVREMHNVIYVDGNGKGFQSRLLNAEKDAKTALKVALARTAAMWMVFTFSLLAVGGILGYQMYRIDCISRTLTDAITKLNLPL